MIGISNYKNATQLANPKDDANLIADALRSVGFNLIGDRALVDLDKTEFDAAIQGHPTLVRVAFMIKRCLD